MIPHTPRHSFPVHFPGLAPMLAPVLVPALALMLAGCSVSPQPLSAGEHEAAARQDLATLSRPQDPLDQPLTVYDAMARAVKYNLDNRLKLMEQALLNEQLTAANMDMLPRLVASSGYQGRNNTLASNSRSVSSGTQSLESSTSQDRDRYEMDLRMTWNILDFGVSWLRARQQADRALIVAERRRKVVHTMIQDVRSAYWYALSSEHLLRRITPLQARLTHALNTARLIEERGLQSPEEALVYRRNLLEMVRQINSLQHDLVGAKPRLAALMGLPPSADFDLAEPEADVFLPEQGQPAPFLPEQGQQAPGEDGAGANRNGSATGSPAGSPAKSLAKSPDRGPAKSPDGGRLSRLTVTLADIEHSALVNRPELREERYQGRIDELEVHKAMLSLLPGLSLEGSYNHDSNSYTLNNNWIQYGATVSSNLFNLVFGGPTAIRIAEAGSDVGTVRRLALSMAVLSQARISWLVYQQSIADYRTAVELDTLEAALLKQAQAQEKTRQKGEMELMQAELNSILAELRRDIARAELNNAVGRLFVTAGADPLPQTVENHNVATLSTAIHNTSDGWLQGVLPETPAAGSSPAGNRPESPPEISPREKSPEAKTPESKNPDTKNQADGQKPLWQRLWPLSWRQPPARPAGQDSQTAGEAA